MKCVHLEVELEDRTPVSVMSADFFVTYFDENGGIDQKKKVEAQRLAVNMTGADFATKPSEDSVIDIKPKLYKKRYDHQFRWVPTEKETTEIKPEIQRILAPQK